MRRCLFMFICALGLTTVLHVPASAQGSPDLCTDQVYVEPGLGFSAESNELRSAMSMMRSYGADARVLYLEDFQDYDNLEDYAYEYLAEECPNLFFEEDGYLYPAADLVMLVDARDPELEFPIGEIVGDNFIDYVDYDELGNDLTANFNAISGNIEEANHDSVGPPQEPTPAADNVSINWGAVFIGIGIVAVVIVIIALVAMLIMKRRAQQARQRQVNEYLAECEQLQATWSSLAFIDELKQLNIQHWLAQLPDDEDDELERLWQLCEHAVAGGGDALQRARDLLGSIESDEDLYEAQAALDEARTLITSGKEAEAAIQPELDELEKIKADLPGNLTEATEQYAAIDTLIQQRQTEGFLVRPFLERAVAVGTMLQEAKRQMDEGYILKADDLWEDIEDDLEALKAELDELPELPNRLTTEADGLAATHAALESQCEDATLVADTLNSVYHAADGEGMYEAVQQSRQALARAEAYITNARKAAGMDQQDWDGAVTALEEAGKQLDAAKGLVALVAERQELLRLLKATLPGTISELRVELEQARTYVHGVSRDISDETQRQLIELQERFNRISGEHLRRDATPSLLKIEAGLRLIDGELDTCLAQARAQHEAREQLRTAVSKRRNEYIRLLGQAVQYQTYASEAYRQAASYQTRDVASMDLEQLYQHWDNACEAADTAHGQGKDAYDAAHRPVYVPSYRRDDDYDAGSVFDIGSRPSRSRPSPSRPSLPSSPSRPRASSPSRSSSSRSRSSSSSTSRPRPRPSRSSGGSSPQRRGGVSSRRRK